MTSSVSAPEHGERRKSNSILDALGGEGGGTDEHKHIGVFSDQHQQRGDARNQIEGKHREEKQGLHLLGQLCRNQLHPKAQQVVHRVDDDADPQ